MKKLILVLVVMPMVCLADDNVPSGTCGENCNWKIEDGTLKITGGADGTIGTMDAGARWIDGVYTYIQPWKNYKDDFNKVDIQGVRNVSHAAFREFSNITDIKLGDTIKTIEDYAFSGNRAEVITLPDSLERIGYLVFSNNSNEPNNIKKVIISDTLILRGENTNSIFGANEQQLANIEIVCRGNQVKCRDVLAGYSYYDFSTREYSEFALDDNVVPAKFDSCNSTNFYWNGNECLREPDVTKRKCCNNCKNLSGLCHRLIYSVEEANKVAKPSGNTVRIKYR